MNHVPDMRVSVDDQMSVGVKHRDAWLQLHPNTDSIVAYAFPTLSSSLSWVVRDPSPLETGVIDHPRVPHDIHLQVFVTGSLYLVGNSFSVLGEQLY